MSSQKKLSMSLGEAIFTQRAIRRMKPDPIPLNDIKTFLEAAVKAPNGGNAQPARFVVINERAKIEALGKLYLEAWWAKRREIQGWQSIADIPPDDTIYLAATRFAEAFGEVPLVVLPVAPKGTSANSVFPWLQNMMLAATSLGFGTLWFTFFDPVEVRPIISVPGNLEIVGLLYVGKAAGEVPSSRRRDPVIYADSYGVDYDLG